MPKKLLYTNRILNMLVPRNKYSSTNDKYDIQSKI